MSCSDNNWKYELEYPNSYKVNDIWFSGDQGLFCGYFSSLENSLIKNNYKRWSLREAIIMRVSPEKKVMWEKVYSNKGEILQINETYDGNLFALGREYAAKGGKKAYLISSNDLGKTWSELPETQQLFIGIAFGANSFGYAWTEEGIYYTDDLGANWKIIADSMILRRGWAQPTMDRKGALWVYNNGQLIKLLSNGTKIADKVDEVIKVDDLFVANDNSLWAVGRGKGSKEGLVLLLKKSKINEIKIEAELPSFLPEKLFVGENSIFIYGSDVIKVPPKRVLLISNDHAVHWRSETPKDAYANGPVYFENENIIWNVATKGRIQRRGPGRPRGHSIWGTKGTPLTN